MNTPKCPGCGTASWTGTYRAQVERTWAVGVDALEPTLEHEDEDFGEWDEVMCSACHRPASGRMRDRVLWRLLGSA